jgi:hypothetical protein
LPLQVGGLNEIAVEDSNAADSSAHQETCCSRADCSTTYNDGTGGKQAMLPEFAESREEHLARVPFVD